MPHRAWRIAYRNGRQDRIRGGMRRQELAEGLDAVEQSGRTRRAESNPVRLDGELVSFFAQAWVAVQREVDVALNGIRFALALRGLGENIRKISSQGE